MSMKSNSESYISRWGRRINNLLTKLFNNLKFENIYFSNFFMQFLKKQFQPSHWFVLVPTGIESLTKLIKHQIDLSSAFCVYHGDNISESDPRPIVWHAWEFAWKILAPMLSFTGEESYRVDKNGRRVYMLGMDDKNPRIIQVPTWIPLDGMRDSYRYLAPIQTFYTRQSVKELLDWLRRDWWEDYLYTKQNPGPMDFTPVAELNKHLQKI
jgi:hypothetical protein